MPKPTLKWLDRWKSKGRLLLFEGRREVPAILQSPVEGIMVDQDRGPMAEAEVARCKVIDRPVEPREAAVAAQRIDDLEKMMEFEGNKD